VNKIITQGNCQIICLHSDGIYDLLACLRMSGSETRPFYE